MLFNSYYIKRVGWQSVYFSFVIGIWSDWIVSSLPSITLLALLAKCLKPVNFTDINFLGCCWKIISINIFVIQRRSYKIIAMKYVICFMLLAVTSFHTALTKIIIFRISIPLITCKARLLSSNVEINIC